MAGTELADLAAAVKTTTVEELQKALQELVQSDHAALR